MMLMVENARNVHVMIYSPLILIIRLYLDSVVYQGRGCALRIISIMLNHNAYAYINTHVNRVLTRMGYSFT